MQHRLFLYVVTMLTYALPIQCFSEPASIKAFKEFVLPGVLDAVHVTFSQKGSKPQKKQVRTLITPSFTYYIDGGPVTIEATLTDPYYGYTHKIFEAPKVKIEDPKTLLGKSIEIINNKTETRLIHRADGKTEYVDDYELSISVKSDSDNPSKRIPIQPRKIRTYKTVDRDKEWTIVITDKNQNEEISKSTFKRNTDRFARSLYIHLNPKVERYTENIIKVFKRKKAIGKADFTATIKAQDMQPELELSIEENTAKLVPAGKEQK